MYLILNIINGYYCKYILEQKNLKQENHICMQIDLYLF